jgi:hypothetical protein
VPLWAVIVVGMTKTHVGAPLAFLSVRRIKVLNMEVAKERFGADESVKQCLEIMGEVSEEERSRGRHFDVKAGTLVAFSAVTLALNATLGRPLLTAHLDHGAHVVVRDGFLASVTALAAAAAIALLGVLRPLGHHDLTEAQIDAYSNREKMNTPPQDLRETWLRTVTEMAISDRKANNFKSRMSMAAAILLAIGVVGVAAEAFTMGVQ